MCDMALASAHAALIGHKGEGEDGESNCDRWQDVGQHQRLRVLDRATCPSAITIAGPIFIEGIASEFQVAHALIPPSRLLPTLPIARPDSPAFGSSEPTSC
jgi:hypothetical protein